MDSRVDRLRALGREHGAALALTAIVAVAAIIRFATLGDQSLDHDEAVTAARVLHPSFLQSMQVVVNGERSPPLYYVLIWGFRMGRPRRQRGRATLTGRHARDRGHTQWEWLTA
jgi:hypothetical protein